MLRLIVFVFVLTFTQLAMASETESEPEEAVTHRRQLSRVIKKGHRQFVSLINFSTLPAVLDARQAKTPSDFIRKRSQFKKETRARIEKLRTRNYMPDQGELNKALILASRYVLAETIALLLEWGAQVNAQDRGGRTAAMCACIYGNYQALGELIDQGADLTMIDDCGKTALMYSCPGQFRLKISEWGATRMHETQEVDDPKTKCRILIESAFEKKQSHLQATSSADHSRKCLCLIC